MKRIKVHAALTPFARDHGIGLVCAQRLHKSVKGTSDDRIRLAEQVRSVCSDMLASSLEDEHRILTRAVAETGLGHTFQQHHNKVRDLLKELKSRDSNADPGLGLISRIADALDDYVRWEENTLFPAIADKVKDQELKELTEITKTIEEHRHRPTQDRHSSVALDKSPGHAVPCSCSMIEHTQDNS